MEIKMNRLLSRLPKSGFLSGTISKVLTIGILSASLPLFVQIEHSVAQTCNAFGCSQPGAGACNPFGCPNPGADPCTPFGCPASPTPSSAPPARQPQIGGSPQAIASCMKNLMYEQRLVCTRSRCSQLNREDGWGGWQLQTVRTEISEAAAVQACQNAR
jgi:hypothetical protein